MVIVNFVSVHFIVKRKRFIMCFYVKQNSWYIKVAKVLHECIYLKPTVYKYICIIIRI